MIKKAKATDLLNDGTDFDLYNHMVKVSDKINGKNADVDIITMDENGTSTVKVSEMREVIENITKIKGKFNDTFLTCETTDKEYEDLARVYCEEIAKYVPVSSLEENCEEKYPNINFENLNDKTKIFITTGDEIYNCFCNSKINNIDYSPVIIEWCKAVELELCDKIFYFLNKSQIKQDLSEKSALSYKYKRDFMIYGNNTWKLEINGKFGFFESLRDYQMEDYLFDKYLIKNYPNFMKKDFYLLVDNVIKIKNYRNNSAHPTYKLSIEDAKQCKNYILPTKKVLEILSKLKITL